VGLQRAQENLLRLVQPLHRHQSEGVLVGDGLVGVAHQGVRLPVLLGGGDEAAALAEQLPEVGPATGHRVVHVVEVAEGDLPALLALLGRGVLPLEHRALRGGRGLRRRGRLRAEIGHPALLEGPERFAGGLLHRLLVRCPGAHRLDDGPERPHPVLLVKVLGGEEHLRERGGRILPGGELGHRGVHPGEGNEVVLLHPLGEQAAGGGRERPARRAAPAGFEVLGQGLLEPDGDRVVPGLRDDQVRVLVRQRVQPIVTPQQGLRRGHHQLVELADGDGAGLVDLLLGEGRDPRELRSVVHHLDPDLSGRGMAEVLLQRRPLRLERLQRIGREHCVLSLRVDEDEVVTLRPLVVAGDGQRVAGQAEVAPRSILHAGQLERRDRVRVAALAEGHPAGEEVERLVLLPPLPEPVELGARGDVVLLVEQLLERTHPGTHVRRRGPGHTGQEQEAGSGGSPHFTSSS
jgi:hypothetical protein